ncbi:MAG: exosortase/archaeosortase family protein [Desulfomonilia bacterium]|jgi:exosortase
MALTQRNVHLALWAMLAAAFILCYHPTFLWLHYKYSLEESYFSHGYLIPFVSAYLIYAMRNDLSAMPRSSSPIGLAVIVAALMVHILGVLGDINFVSGFSMVLYLAGCSLYLLGGPITGKIFFPLFFLVFMCPIPDAVIDAVALPLKAIATSVSLMIVDLLGIPYVREGFVIHLPGSTYVVGAPCNGMRSLISFFAIGFLFLYYIRSAWWKKGVLLLLIPPISVALNGLRIAILLFIANHYGHDAASPESFLHDGSGMLVFVIGIGLLVLCVRRINEEDRA